MDLSRLAGKAYDHQARLDTLARAQPLAAWKASLTGRSSGTRTTDPDLLVAGVAANTVYEFRAGLFWWSATAGTGLFMGWVPPGGGGACGGKWGGTGNVSGLGMANQGFDWDATVIWGTPAGQDNGIVLAGVLITGGTAGNFSLGWATGSGTATTNLNKGSYFALTRLAAA